MRLSFLLDRLKCATASDATTFGKGDNQRYRRAYHRQFTLIRILESMSAQIVVVDLSPTCTFSRAFVAVSVLVAFSNLMHGTDAFM